MQRYCYISDEHVAAALWEEKELTQYSFNTKVLELVKKLPQMQYGVKATPCFAHDFTKTFLYTIYCSYKDGDTFGLHDEYAQWGVFQTAEDAYEYIDANHQPDEFGWDGDSKLVNSSMYPWGGYFSSEHAFSVKRLEILSVT